MKHQPNEISKARNITLLLGVGVVLLVSLFISEYIKSGTTETILGRAPLIVIAIGFFLYRLVKYLKLKKRG